MYNIVIGQLYTLLNAYLNKCSYHLSLYQVTEMGVQHRECSQIQYNILAFLKFFITLEQGSCIFIVYHIPQTSQSWCLVLILS